MDTMKAIADRYEDELLHSVVPFWEKFGIDTQYGGFFTCLERDGRVYDRLKQLWMQWRAVYMFAALYNSEYSEERYLKYAVDGFDFLLKHGKRPDGFYYLMLDADGGPLALDSEGMAVFVESFAAIACAELYRATGQSRYLEEARSALTNYRRRVKMLADGECCRRKHAFFAHPMIELNTVAILLEAQGGEPDNALAESLFAFRNPENGLIVERKLADGGFELDRQDGRVTNPGHALEGMLFVLEHCRSGGDAGLLAPALEVIRATLKWGWDEHSGGIRYFRDLHDRPLLRNEAMLKAWWPQNEAAAAALCAWKVTGDDEFLAWFRRIDAFAWKNLRDPQYGEWFAYAAVDGKQFHAYKGSRTKGFFHVPRYLLKCLRLGRS